MKRKRYNKPTFVVHEIDTDIQLQMGSGPPLGPEDWGGMGAAFGGNKSTLKSTPMDNSRMTDVSITGSRLTGDSPF